MSSIATTSTRSGADADLGEEINWLIQRMGGYCRIIVPPGHYQMAAPVVAQPGTEIQFGAGDVRCLQPVGQGTFVGADGFSLRGAGWGTRFYEPPSYVLWITPADLTYGWLPGVTGVHLSDFQIVGNPDIPNSAAAQNIVLGNSHNVHVDRLAFNGSKGYGVNAGSGSAEGNRAEDVWVERCWFRGLGITLSAVNCLRFHYVGNTILQCGTPIDSEPNTTSDLCEDFEIVGNIIVGNAAPNQGRSGITLQGRNTRNGVVRGNVIRRVSSGLYINNASDILFADNLIDGTWSNGVGLTGALRVAVRGNKIMNAGAAGGYPTAVALTNSGPHECDDCIVEGNEIAGGSAWIYESGSGNRIRNNRLGKDGNGGAPKLTIEGASAGSQAWANDMDGTMHDGAMP